MTREAVIEKLEEYIHTVAIQAIDELDPSRVMEVDLPSEAIKSAMRDDIRQEMIQIKASFEDQCRYMVDVGDPETDAAVEDLLEAFLDADVFYPEFVGDDDARRALEDDLEDYFARSAVALEPLVASDADGFWPAMVESYGQDAFDEFFVIFRRAEIVEPHAEYVRITMDLDTGLPIDEVEYTDEAVRVFRAAEEYLRAIIRAEAESAYGD